jgi:hypothetical protein
MATYTLESSQNTTDHLNKHFPTIYKVSQRHTLRDIYRWHNNFWFIVCEQIFSDTIARGVVVDRKVGANFIRWRESGGVSFKTFKTEKQKQKVFRLQTPLITSWFRENIWMLQMQLFLNLCTQMWEGRNTFWKGVCAPFFLPPAPAWVNI